MCVSAYAYTKQQHACVFRRCFITSTTSPLYSLPCNGRNYDVVCELDLVFSLHKSLLILFEMFIGGMLCESNKREVLKAIGMYK